MIQSISRTPKNISDKNSRRASLQTRLIIFVLLTALIPLIITSALNIRQTQQALTNAAKVSLQSGAQQTANSLDTFVNTNLDSIRVESQFSDFSDYLVLPSNISRRAQANELLTKLSKKNENIISYALTGLNGVVLLDSLITNIQKNESADEYFKKARISDEPIVTAVTYFDDQTAIIVFANSVHDSDGKLVGILRATYRSNVLQEVIANSVGETSDIDVILLDQLTIRMADTRNPELILKSLTPLNVVDFSTAVSSRRFLNLPSKEQATNLTDFAAALANAKTQPFFTMGIHPDLTSKENAQAAEPTPGNNGTAIAVSEPDKVTELDSVAIAFLKTQPWSVAYSRPTSIFLADIQKQNLNNTLLVIGASILAAIVAAVTARTLSNPITALAKVADSISQGDLNARAKVTSTDEIGVLASAFNTMTDQLQSTLIDMEQRINERTRDLQKKNLEMETIADVAREISIIHDMDTLLKVSVDLIRERFKYYHVGIFLVDDRNEYALLSAASSIAAEQMLANNYKLKVGQTGLVGNVTRTGQAYIALDVGTDAVHFENPFLPETRSEIVLPLRSHNVTIGALDIQANVPTAFNEKDLLTLQILADQLTAAIENAQLTQQIEGNLATLTVANRLQTQQIWHSVISEQENPAYEYDGLRVRAVPPNLSDSLLSQLELGKPIVTHQPAEFTADDKKQKSILMVPLLILNQVIGVIGLEQEDPNHIWTNEEINIAQAAANRTALTLENARLLDESQRRAAKERAIFESTARIGSALNIENILKTTAEELEKVLGSTEVVLQFQSDDSFKTE